MSLELRDMFSPGPSQTGPSRSPATTISDSFASRAERLCTNALGARRRKKPVQTRVKEWTKNFVLIDFQGYDKHVIHALYDYNKIFDGPIRILSTMSEEEVRAEIVRLVGLKWLPTHTLSTIQPNSFNFVKVYNRRVRSLDGDVPCDGSGLAHIYRSGSVYARLVDTTLWVGDRVIEVCLVFFVQNYSSDHSSIECHD